jgi:predicted TIM-barrel fold metal-dependent hydrolase
MAIRVTANHAHVFPSSMKPEGTIERLLRLMDECGIEQTVCFPPFPHQCTPENTSPGFYPSGWVAREIASRPRLLGFGTIDFKAGDFRGQIRRVVELGLKGLKLHPNQQSFPIVSPQAFEVYGAAEEAGLFCTFHSGVHASRLKDARVLDFDEVARNFPNLRFSMEHVGGYHFFNEALAVLFNNVPPPWEHGPCNVYGGLASVFTQHQNRFWYLSPERIKELIAQVGAKQCIFGLDFPFNLERETKMGLETIASLGLTADDQALILGGNLRRLLAIA